MKRQRHLSLIVSFERREVARPFALKRSRSIPFRRHRRAIARARARIRGRRRARRARDADGDLGEIEKKIKRNVNAIDARHRARRRNVPSTNARDDARRAPTDGRTASSDGRRPRMGHVVESSLSVCVGGRGGVSVTSHVSRMRARDSTASTLRRRFEISRDTWCPE